MNDNKNRNLYLYFVKMFLIFIILDIIMIIAANVVAQSSLLSKFGVDLITEIFYSFVILIVMLLFRNSYVFTNKNEKFWKGVKLAFPMLLISIFSLLSAITSLKSFSLDKFINIFFLCLFVGIAEEFLCRGWLQNEFIERFSNNKRNVIISIIMSSFIFGFMHIINLSSQTLFDTFLQIINAFALGFLLGSIYYKTKNIWSVIFLHSFYDFSIFLKDMDVIKSCTHGDLTMGIALVNIISTLIISLIWIFSALIILNKCDEFTSNNKSNSKYKVVILLLFISLFIPFNKLVKEYNEYETCYKYESIELTSEYTINYPKYNQYVINSDNTTLKLSIKDKKVHVYDEYDELYDVLKIEDVKDMFLIDNGENYILVVLSEENESTIYMCTIIKGNAIESFKNIDLNYKKYYLPKIDNIGYLTISDDTYIPYFVSKDKDSFVIIKNELFIVNK